MENSSTSIRENSIHYLNKFNISGDFIQSEVITNVIPRSQNEIIKRALCLNALLISIYGQKRKVCLDWLNRHTLTDSLSPKELKFMEGGRNNYYFEYSYENLYTIVYALGLLPGFGVTDGCPDSLYKLLPNILIDESPEKFSTKCKDIIISDLIQWLDIYIIVDLYWASKTFRDKEFNLTAIERRKNTLQWMLGISSGKIL